MEVTELEFFPRLTYTDLCLYACGTYQMKQTPGYYADHINDSGDFEFQVAVPSYNIDFQKYQIDVEPINAILLKTKLHSRHSNSLKYFVYY